MPQGFAGRDTCARRGGCGCAQAAGRYSTLARAVRSGERSQASDEGMDRRRRTYERVRAVAGALIPDMRTYEARTCLRHHVYLGQAVQRTTSRSSTSCDGAKHPDVARYVVHGGVRELLSLELVCTGSGELLAVPAVATCMKPRRWCVGTPRKFQLGFRVLMKA